MQCNVHPLTQLSVVLLVPSAFAFQIFVLAMTVLSMVFVAGGIYQVRLRND